MSDDPPQERRSSRRGVAGPENARDDAARNKGARRELPSLDEVFIDDDDVEIGEEDTRSVAAVDALGQPTLLDLEENTQVLDSNPFEVASPPSSTRLSAPPPLISVRPRISAPPMAVSQVRAPTGAPPPFVQRMPTIDLSDEIEYSPPEDYDSAPRAAVPPAPPQFITSRELEPEPAEYVEAELYSEPVDQRPAAQPAQALRASTAPWEVSRSADPSLNALFAASGSRPKGLTPPPPLNPSSRAPNLASYAPSSAPTPMAPPLEELPTAPALDRFQAPKTLVSGPAPDLAREPFPSSPAAPVQKSRSGATWAFALFAVGAAFGGFWYLETTQPGSLLLDVRTPENEPVSGLALYLDGELVCRAAPCEIAELPRGTHFVRAEADGFPTTADQAVTVLARQRTQHDVVLERPPGDGRVSISTATPGFQINLDGTVRGVSPLEITGVEPGEHTLMLEKEGFESTPLTVVVEQGRTLNLSPAPRLLQGRLQVTAAAGSEDAEVRLDGELVALPMDRSLDAARVHILTATKPGRGAFEKQFQFTAEQPTAVLRLDLSDDSGETSASLEAGKARAADSLDGPGAGSGKATLNLNSLPRSMVVLDGRPLGQTPLMGVQVSPGSHNIVFVHPERGRKPVQVDVDAGAKRTVSVRF